MATFRKGEVNNPHGRPKGDAEFRERCRRITDHLSIQAWEKEVAEHGPSWLKCSELLAAYGYGKPPQAAEDRDALREAVRIVLPRIADEAPAKGDE